MNDWPSLWTADHYIDAMVALMRQAIADSDDYKEVEIYSAPIHDAEMVPDMCVVFIDCNTDERDDTIGNTQRDERYSWEGVIQVLTRGYDEEAAVECRTKAVDIMRILAGVVREYPDAGLNEAGNRQYIRFSAVTRKRLRQAKQEGFKRCVVEFDLTVSTKV